MILVAAVNVAVVWNYTQISEKSGNAIDVAGSNRMLAQRTGFVAFMIKDGHPDQEMLQSAVDRIDTNLDAVENGGTVEGKDLDPAPSEASDELEEVKSQGRASGKHPRP